MKNTIPAVVFSIMYHLAYSNWYLDFHCSFLYPYVNPMEKKTPTKVEEKKTS